MRWKAEVRVGDQQGRTLVDHTALTDNAIWKTSNLIGGCGLKFPSDVDTTSPFFQQLCKACVGRTSMWLNKVEQDQNGNDRNSIIRFEQDGNQEVIDFAPEDDAEPEWAG